MDSSEYSSFRRKLLRWYASEGRELPWRRTRDPYLIWISEIMLQQTTVAAVVPYFERFQGRFPTLAALAGAPESEVLRLWEGLGYYSRARNIHKAARAIVEQYQGIFPRDVEALQTLPGIGRYTAGAIASFAYDQPAPIVEANTLRLYSRLLGYDGDPRSAAGQQILWSFAENILPQTSPGRVNQALMELGATVCSPKAPRCDACPVREHCRAFLNGTQAAIPRPKARLALTEITEVSIAIRHGTNYLLRRRTSNERWAGLWDFIRFQIDANAASVDPLQIVQSTEARTGLKIELEPQIAEMKHGVTRYLITLKCFTARRRQGRLNRSEEWAWVAPAEFDGYPLSVTARKFAERLKSTVLINRSVKSARR